MQRSTEIVLPWSQYAQWILDTVIHYGVHTRTRDEFNYIFGSMQSEAGEAFDALKKATRQEDFGQEMLNQHLPMILEMGDTCWYLTRGCQLLGITLDELMLLNIYKVWKRLNDDDKRYATKIPERMKKWPLTHMQPDDALKLIQRIACRITAVSVSTFMATGMYSRR